MLTNRYLLLYCFAICTATLAMGQQMPLYSLSILNKYRMNQAYAGLDNAINATGVYRSQWVDFPGAPESYQVNVFTPMYRLHGGMGLFVDADKIGAERTLQVGLSYNYIKTFSQLGYLSFSGTIALLQKSFDGRVIRTPDGNYEGGSLDHKDGILSSVLSKGSSPMAHLGVYFANDNLEAGISCDNLWAPKLKASDESFTFKPRNHINAYFEYLVPLSEQIGLVPSVMLRTDLVAYQSDINVKVQFRNTLFGGMALRGYNRQSFDAIAVFVGYHINQNLLIAYNYDFTISAIQNYSRGSHELVVNYKIGKNWGPAGQEPILYSPRFL